MRMRAEWDYDAVSPDELSIRKGDELVVLGDGEDEGWLLAETAAPIVSQGNGISRAHAVCCESAFMSKSAAAAMRTPVSGIHRCCL